jgi:protein-tyrosine sulfotransferase
MAWRLFSLCTAALMTLIAQESQGNSACETKMQAWIDEQYSLFPEDRPTDALKMLFFLHVPRSAGRTTHNCFLMPSTPPSRRCAKSYDGNKYNISVPGCGLLSSHDDFSAVRQFPSFAAVYTSIRHPYSRVLSAYEFAVEIASRAAARVVPMKEPDKAQGRVSTRNVWPWSYLAPFVEEDMIARVRWR